MKILNIPFISKPKAKSFTKWIAKYVINDNWLIIDEWCELLEWTEFRWKDKYWTKFNKNVINFRKELMLSHTINEKLSSEKLKYVNNYFFDNLFTILSHDKFTTWSNPTWSDYNIKRTPYIIYWWKYNQYMFINFFKNIRKKEKKYIRNSNLEQIDLEKYLQLFPIIKNDFNNFNKILFTALESEEINEETQKIDNSSDVWEYIDLILSNDYKLEINDEKEKNELRIWKLRRIFKNRLRNIKPTDHLFWKLPEDMCEAAHIYPVSEIKKMDLRYWYMIADENNWINLPTQFHKLYDSNKIYFDESWEVLFTNNEYKNYLKLMFPNNNNYKIINSLLNEKRKNYIHKYNIDILKK